MPKADAVVDNSLVDDDPVEGVNDDGDEIDSVDAVDDAKKNDQEERQEAADGDREELEIVIEGEDEADPDQGALNNDEKEEKEEKGGKKSPDERTQYSKEVQARIGREQRIARDANARAQAAHQGRLAAEARSRAVQKDALDITESALDSHLKSTKAALTKAMEDGKTEEQIDLQNEMTRLTTRKEAVATSKRNLDAEIEAAKRGGAADGPNHLAQDWMRRNKWFTDPRFAEQAAHTRLIDKSLEAKGYDKNSSDYFAELDRQIKRRLPEIVKLQQRPGNEDGGERPPQQRQQRREPTGGVQRGAGAAAGKGKVVLKSADLQNMRAFGLDPANKEHQREYALNKMNGGR